MAEFVPDEKARRTPRLRACHESASEKCPILLARGRETPEKKRRAFASHARRAKEWLLDRESLLSFGIHAGLQTGRGDSACGVGAVPARRGRGGDRRRRPLPAGPGRSRERETSRGQGHRRRRPGRAVLLEDRAAARASGSAVAAVGADPLGEQPPVRVELLDPVVGAIGHVHVAGAVNGDPGSDHGRILHQAEPLYGCAVTNATCPLMAEVVPGENSRRRPRLRRRARRIRNTARSFWHAAPRLARRTRARVTTRGGPGVEVWLVRWSYTLWRVRVSAGASGTRGTVSALSRGWFQLLPSRQRAAASSSFGALVGDGGASISSSLSGPRN